MSSWIDTETKAILQKLPPEKLALPDIAGFTLVALSNGDDRARFLRAIRRVSRASQHAAGRLLMQPLPFAVKAGLSYPDALFGQFEFISADAISVFLDDSVFNGGSPEYLRELYAQLLETHPGSEFELVSLRVESLPATKRGNEFIDQFLGSDILWRSHAMTLPRKKARIMEHWAEKIGGVVSWLDS